MPDNSNIGESEAAPQPESNNEYSSLSRREHHLVMFEEHRQLLLSVAYRMLGRRTEAEDMLQETFLRWQKTSEGEIRDTRAFLVTVITRLCINELESARAKREEYFGQWLPEPVLSGTAEYLKMPGIDGSLSLAFLILLQRLTPMERATFLLHEVFDYDYSDIASVLSQNEANCRQILRRAKQHISQDRPRFEASPERREKLLQQFLETITHGDLQGLIGLLTEDVVLYSDGGGKASAVPNPIYGANRVARLLLGATAKLVPRDVIRRFAEINGQTGIVAYHNGRVRAVLTADIVEGRIRNFYIVTNPDKLVGIPDLPAAPV
jgi:RNA polymerase sigma-70 factor, ECF subfamily